MLFHSTSPPMTPLEYYREQCHKRLIAEDEQQVLALLHLQSIYFDLIGEYHRRQPFYALLRKPKTVPGAYLWGGVGIGKTFIMDCFYHCLPFQNKMRVHFHQFMQNIQQELKNYQGKKNPLALIAKKLAKQTLLICLDELHVTDIADAIVLANLFKALMHNGICIVTTTNAMPDDLYKDGLQRIVFLPAIALLKKALTIIHISTAIDYRLKHLKTAGVFYFPNDEIAAKSMAKSFSLLSEGRPYRTGEIEIGHRAIQIIKQAGDIIWFDFSKICGVPRSQQDYLAIANTYKTIFISNIPCLSVHDKNKICLFIRMIDVFYDARIRLVCSLEVSIENIYKEEQFGYTRTQSRLLEMQSENYFLFYKKN